MFVPSGWVYAIIGTWEGQHGGVNHPRLCGTQDCYVLRTFLLIRCNAAVMDIIVMISFQPQLNNTLDCNLICKPIELSGKVSVHPNVVEELASKVRSFLRKLHCILDL